MHHIPRQRCTPNVAPVKTPKTKSPHMRSSQQATRSYHFQSSRPRTRPASLSLSSQIQSKGWHSRLSAICGLLTMHTADTALGNDVVDHRSGMGAELHMGIYGRSVGNVGEVRHCGLVRSAGWVLLQHLPRLVGGMFLVYPHQEPHTSVCHVCLVHIRTERTALHR